MMYEDAHPDPKVLKDLMTAIMPYGKYKNRKIKDLPVYYLEWLEKHGFPDGKLGMLLHTAHVIKTNQLEYIIKYIQP